MKTTPQRGGYQRKYRTGHFIREHLSRGEDFGNNIYRTFKAYLKELGYRSPSYASFMGMLRRLEKLGLIAWVRNETVPSLPYPRRYLSLVKSRAADPAWDDPGKAIAGGR